LLEKITSLQQGSVQLSDSLAAERQTTERMTGTISAAESKLAEQAQKYAAIQEENYGMREKIQKKEKIIIILSGVLGGLVLVSATCFLLKSKFKIF
jgi:hypothetical protein